jgi:hypothetical protein
MNRKEAQERNWKIARLTAALPTIIKLIPEDIKQTINPNALHLLEKIFRDINLRIKEAKKINYLCCNCTDPGKKKPSKNKKIYKCDGVDCNLTVDKTSLYRVEKN